MLTIQRSELQWFHFILHIKYKAVQSLPLNPIHTPLHPLSYPPPATASAWRHPGPLCPSPQTIRWWRPKWSHWQSSAPSPSPHCRTCSKQQASVTLLLPSAGKGACYDWHSSKQVWLGFVKLYSTCELLTSGNCPVNIYNFNGMHHNSTVCWCTEFCFVACQSQQKTCDKQCNNTKRRHLSYIQ